jgi:HSP20 family protein
VNTHTPYSNGRRLGTLLSWDPVRLFDDLMTWEPEGSQTVWAAYPSPVKVERSEDGATITVDMPGVDHADLDLTLVDGTLAITGKRGEHTYRYSVALGDAIDPERVDAALDKGVLTVRAHKKTEAKPRKILVTAKAIDSGENK